MKAPVRAVFERESACVCHVPVRLTVCLARQQQNHLLVQMTTTTPAGKMLMGVKKAQYFMMK